MGTPGMNVSLVAFSDGKPGPLFLEMLSLHCRISDGKPGTAFPENALFALSHFRTENRGPLFLKML
jgi:hypothetical protein